MVHAVALFALSESQATDPDVKEANRTIAKLWVGGTFLFSGSLYGTRVFSRFTVRSASNRTRLLKYLS